MKVDLLIVDAEPAMHRPTQVSGIRMQSSDLHCMLPVFRFEGELEIYMVRVTKDRLCPEVALVENLDNLKQRIQTFV
jgi:hypothetical protein